MTNIDEDFVLEMRIQFCHDGVELIEKIESILMDLEKSISETNIKALQRELHCLKGNARAVGFENISKITHDIETLCGDKNLPSQIDDLLHVFDTMSEKLRDFLSTKDPATILSVSYQPR